jgi:hypothetical protein
LVEFADGLTLAHQISTCAHLPGCGLSWLDWIDLGWPGDLLAHPGWNSSRRLTNAQSLAWASHGSSGHGWRHGTSHPHAANECGFSLSSGRIDFLSIPRWSSPFRRAAFGSG